MESSDTSTMQRKKPELACFPHDLSDLVAWRSVTSILDREMMVRVHPVWKQTVV